MATGNDFLARYVEQHKNQLRAAKERLLALTEQLKTAGVAKIEMEFSGSGDDGQSNGIVCLNANGESVEFPQGDIEADLYQFTPDGYENNEGGGGTVTFDVATGKILVSAYLYETVQSDLPEEEY